LMLCRLAVVFPVQREVDLVLFQDYCCQQRKKMVGEQDYYLLSSGV